MDTNINKLLLGIRNPLTYQNGNYIFRMNKKLSHIFHINNGEIGVKDAEELEIFQFAPNLEFGGKREILVNLNDRKKSIFLMPSNVLIICKDRIVSFINENLKLKDYFIRKIREEMLETAFSFK